MMINMCRYIRIGVPPARVSRPLASRCRLTGKGAMVSSSGVCAKRIVVDASTTCSAAYPPSSPRNCSTTRTS
jgi:hypothetical protein